MHEVFSDAIERLSNGEKVVVATCLLYTSDAADE